MGLRVFQNQSCVSMVDNQGRSLVGSRTTAMVCRGRGTDSMG